MIDNVFHQQYVDQKIPEMLSGLHRSIKEIARNMLSGPEEQRFNDAQLISELERAICDEISAVEIWQEKIHKDLSEGDQIQKQFMMRLASALFSQVTGSKKSMSLLQHRNLPQGHAYSVLSKCSSCFRDKKRKGKFQQIMPVEEYVPEADFRAGLMNELLQERNYRLNCLQCGDALEPINSFNIIFPGIHDRLIVNQDDSKSVFNFLPDDSGAVLEPYYPIIPLLLGRIKSGTYIDKLLMSLCYPLIKPELENIRKKINNPNKNFKSRSKDRYAITIPLNIHMPADYLSSTRMSLQDRERKYRADFIRQFRSQFDVGLQESARDFEQHVCETMFKIVRDNGARIGYEVLHSTLDNTFENPRDTKYKMVQFELLMNQGYSNLVSPYGVGDKFRIEVKLVSLRTHFDEDLERSRYSHASYREEETKMRRAALADIPGIYVLEEFLRNIFNDTSGRRICRLDR